MNYHTISFRLNEVYFYLDWEREPVTSVFTFMKLNDSVDLEKAGRIAKDITLSCDSVSIRLNEGREMMISCSTIVPDAKSLWNILPYMLSTLGRAYAAFEDEYGEATADRNAAESPTFQPE